MTPYAFVIDASYGSDPDYDYGSCIDVCEELIDGRAQGKCYLFDEHIDWFMFLEKPKQGSKRYRSHEERFWIVKIISLQKELIGWMEINASDDRVVRFYEPTETDDDKSTFDQSQDNDPIHLVYSKR